jgi:hypothetical protein
LDAIILAPAAIRLASSSEKPIHLRKRNAKKDS